ncbi:MAG: response regulator [Proteobacteria bacterium]|nr:response regulator [Pseudomonadota bacterium]
MKRRWRRSWVRRWLRLRGSRDARAEQRLDAQWRLVWAHSRLGSLAASLFAVLVAVKLRDEIAPAWAVDAWLVAKLGVAGWRTWLAWHYGRPGHEGGRRWRRDAALWLVIDGAVWGVAGCLAATAPVPLASLLVASLAGVSCAATFGLQISLPATAAYIVPLLTPAVIALILRGDDLAWIGAPGLILLTILQLATAARSDRRQSEALLLAQQAEALAREKEEALKLALRQSAVKTQFLANISHELRTPLHGILGIARLLRLDRLDAAALHRVELIESSGTHLLALINDLLDISRVEAGQFAIRSEAFELGAQIEHLAGVYAARAQEKGLVFEVSNRVAGRRWLIGDPARFRQVLHNLLGNAIKFTERGYVHLGVEIDPADQAVHCIVSDSGRGIALEDQSHIFDAFRQAGPEPLQPREGTGLGLTIARDIARAMGGDVTLQSTLGVGTSLRFIARLPAAPEPADDAAQLPVVDEVDAVPGSARGRSALLAEDDDVNALIAAAYLERFGVAVDRVANGAEAVDAALRRDARPDLVLMDCRMPVMDGYEATRRIRAGEAQGGLPRLPVIALTATAGDDDRRLCLDAGMDDFLAKPYTGDQLVRLVDLWLQRQAARHGAG